MKKIVLICSVIFCLSLVACALILVKPSIVYRNAGGISVKGYAVERVTSDAATWTGSVSARGETQAEAYANIKKDSAAAKDFLVSVGANEAELGLSLPSVSPVFVIENGNRTNVVSYYSATVSVSYSSTNIALVGHISRRASELIEQGISFDSYAPQYYYTRLENLKLALLERASANARERAEKLTEGSGSKLGKINSASQGIFQITRPLSSETSDWGMYDTSSVEKDVRCVVTMEFAVEK